MTETCDWDDLVRREGIYYKKSTDVPFTGKVTGKDPEYNRKTQGSFKDGKWDGPYVFYHDNGQLWKKEDPWVFYQEDGTVIEYWSGTFKNGVKISD